MKLYVYAQNSSASDVPVCCSNQKFNNIVFLFLKVRFLVKQPLTENFYSYAVIAIYNPP
jgi:hypothetical protein